MAALVVFAGVAWLHRNRDRFGGGVGYAKDPICGMQVETAQAAVSVERDDALVYFCSEHCRDRFAAAKDPVATPALREPPAPNRV